MKKMLMAMMVFVFLSGCAGVPVREALKEDLKVPAGKVEGNRFTGIRYSFNVSAPPPWKVTVDFPDFMEELGYDRPSPNDRELTELYIYNPETKSNIQFDFTPAGRYSTFSQAKIETLTTIATGSLKSEIEKDYGKGVEVEVGPTEPYSLKGVPYAAKKYARYTARGVKREQGWIYGFVEPYQLFIIYTLLEKEGSNDRQDMKKILDTFEFITKK